ncbi:MAG TPA: alpha-amylase family glycosyl hydrolase [Candidatus Sulfopaludibacter sp.]|jgi:1,4-alpha-glucan branching enzyme|nr:alpha-amylase family glycosyl hydrolase [Candidatus Sulfopaludibacter sp.]
MQPRPTGRPGLLRIPAPSAIRIDLRFAPLAGRDRFDPASWPLHALSASAAFAGWWEFDLDAVALADGKYEYEFVVNGSMIVADPYADELTRFGGYRGVFTISQAKRVWAAFHWDDEFRAGLPLPANNQIVIYEMPVKWMASDPGENASLVELGTFDKVIFEHLDSLVSLGINCIELLPVQDSPQTLNWGYGTRFFFAPDYDIGSAVDARFFVKACHQRGIRVILDVVMNMFATQCPLAALAPEWFREAASDARTDWGQDLFHFSSAAYGAYFAANEFLCEMAEFWVSEYHVDGYRIDDFADIDNWDFVQQFHDRATARSAALFPGKPFLVIAEDSDGRFPITDNRVTDAIWNFGYRNEIHRLLSDQINTSYGQPSRSDRVRHLISKDGVWNDWNHSFDGGYGDLANAVGYITSHDVADAPRLMNLILGPMLRTAGLGDGGVANVRWAIDNVDSLGSVALRSVVDAACRRVFAGFAILMTSVGMPMFLAGEEFGDVHDTDFVEVNSKQQDPVQWGRAQFQANASLQAAVSELMRLRTSYAGLQRNEVDFFYFHPQFDENEGPRVFAYSRSDVVVVANMGPAAYQDYFIPGWSWQGAALTEIGYPAAAPVWNGVGLSLSLDAFSARVFRAG